MDPHLPFLKAIAANPADDLPRLVYADFLEETGEPVHVARAHFIRRQIALEPFLPPSLERFGPEYWDAMVQEGRSVGTFLDVWLLDLPEYLQKQERVTWRRGFPDGIRLGPGFPNDWVGWIGLELFVRHPIRHIQMEQIWGRGVIGWASNLCWRHVVGLRLGPGVTTADEGDGEDPLLHGLMTFPGFNALRSLDLSENRLTNAWLVRFVSQFPDTSLAASLEELDFSNCHTITDAGANALATARGLDRLTVLNLTGVPLSPPAVAMLRRRFGAGLVV